MQNAAQTPAQPPAPGYGEIVGRIFELMERFAFERLKGISQQDPLRNLVSKPAQEDLTLDHWICSVLFSTAGITVSLSIHFATRSARALTLATFGPRARDMAPGSVHDMIKEYANLVMGGVRTSLQQMLEPGQSGSGQVVLPKLEPSYDLVRLDGDGGAKARKSWALCWDGGELVLAASTAFSKDFDPTRAGTLGTSALNISNSGDVEFL